VEDILGVLAPDSEDEAGGGVANMDIKLSLSISGVVLIFIISVSASSSIFSAPPLLDLVQPGIPSACSLSSSNTIKLPSITAACTNTYCRKL
jgi:hypothetical protein